MVLAKIKALEGKDVKDLLTNVGSAGSAAPAAGGAPSGGAAPTEATPAAEEKKEEGMYNSGTREICEIVNSMADDAFFTVQQRKSQTRTWVSVSSTKRRTFGFVFLVHNIPKRMHVLGACGQVSATNFRRGIIKRANCRVARTF